MTRLESDPRTRALLTYEEETAETAKNAEFL